MDDAFLGCATTALLGKKSLGVVAKKSQNRNSQKIIETPSKISYRRFFKGQCDIEYFSRHLLLAVIPPYVLKIVIIRNYHCIVSVTSFLCETQPQLAFL